MLKRNWGLGKYGYRIANFTQGAEFTPLILYDELSAKGTLEKKVEKIGRKSQAFAAESWKSFRRTRHRLTGSILCGYISRRWNWYGSGYRVFKSKVWPIPGEDVPTPNFGKQRAKDLETFKSWWGGVFNLFMRVMWVRKAPEVVSTNGRPKYPFKTLAGVIKRGKSFF